MNMWPPVRYDYVEALATQVLRHYYYLLYFYEDVIGRWDFFYSWTLYFSILTPLFCVSSSVSLSYFVLAVPLRKCLGKHSCMSSSFPIVKLDDTSFFPTVQLQVHNENPSRYGRNTNALVNLNTKLKLVREFIHIGPRDWRGL